MDDHYLHFFETATQCYLYDAISNRILRIDDSVFRQVREDLAARSTIRQEIDKVLGRLTPVLPMGFPMSESSIVETIQSGSKELILEVTEDCLLRCGYCLYSGIYQNQRTHSKIAMPISTARQAISLFLEASSSADSSRIIAFYGGEPLLAYGFIQECVGYASTIAPSIPLRYSFTTNGVLLTREKFDFLRDHRFLMHVSLDGPGWLHDRYRRFPNGHGSFECVASNLRLLRLFDESYYHDCIHFVCTVTDPTVLPKLSDFFETSEFTKGQAVTASSVHRIDLAQPDLFDFDHEAAQQAVTEISARYVDAVAHGRKPNELERGLFDQLVLRLHTRHTSQIMTKIRPNGACLPGTLRLFVRRDGTLFPCERVGSFHSLGHANTGVDTKCALDLINSYCELSAPICQGCWGVRLCSACYIHSQTEDGFSGDRKQTNCLSIRENLHQALTIYCTIMERCPDALDRYLGFGTRVGEC